ncbi:MAG: MATE family efflux transporter, partial [Pseudomonadota bacterium]
LIAGFFANLVLNPWFIYGGFGLPAMGITGIALATLLVQGLGAVYLWIHLRRTGLVETVLHPDLTPKPKALVELMVQAAPLAASLSAIGAFFFLANAYINTFGAAAVAAYGIGLRIEQLVLVPAMAINHASLALTSNNVGAKRFDRVYESWHACIIASAVLLGVGSVLILLFGSQVMRAFSADETVVALGVGYLMIEAFALPAYAFIHTNGGVLQGVKRPAAVMWIGVGRSLVLPAICLPLLIDWAGFGLTSIWWMILVLAWASGLALQWHTWRVLRACSDDAGR